MNLCVLVLSVILPSAAFAAGGAGHESGPGELFWPAINFATYLALMFFLLRKPVVQGMENRHNAMVAALDKASDAVAKAGKELEESQSLLSKVEGEISRIVSEIDRDTQAETRQILDDARVRADRVVDQARKNAEAERKAALEAIRKEIAEVVLQKAEARLRAEIGNDQDRGLRSSVIQNVGTLH